MLSRLIALHGEKAARQATGEGHCARASQRSRESSLRGLNDLLGRLQVDGDELRHAALLVFYAIISGAKAVIISGINPDSSGHVYNDANLKRLHAGTDKQILQALIDRGYPIYTADLDVAKTSGVPLWTEEALKRFTGASPRERSEP